MIQSLKNSFRNGFNAELSGICMLMLFFGLLFKSTVELWSNYELFPLFFCLGLVVASCLWLQSVQFLKKGFKSHEVKHYICSALSSLILALMFIFGNVVMRIIPILAEHYFIIYLALLYGVALTIFGAEILRRSVSSSAG